MIVLRVLGILLLILLALGIALAALVLCSAVRIELRRNMPDGPLRMRVGIGPIKKVFTLGEKRKKKPRPKASEKQKTQEKKPKPPSPPQFDWKRLDVEQAISLALDLIDDLSGAVTWEKLHVTILLHTSDAARTGNLLGTLSAIVGNIYPYMERAFVLQDTKIVIDADFDAQKTVWGVDISIMTRLGRYPRILWRRRKALLALWKSVRTTKEERAQWAKAHAVQADQQDNSKKEGM